ncbi:MAG: cell wall metabolism sensor histidine kinase WalK [Verrucomicrobia bacterium]|nr:cell wall metabolism sensor histidine kinase WalK [Verrucomicrobiota bacterium]
MNSSFHSRRGCIKETGIWRASMKDATIRRINLASFITSLIAIVLGVLVGILGVWGVIPHKDATLWRILATDGIVFAGAVLTNLAIACYRKPGGDVA